MLIIAGKNKENLVAKRIDISCGVVPGDVWMFYIGDGNNIQNLKKEYYKRLKLYELKIF